MSQYAKSDSEPRSLGDFEIIRELGRGGMGVVYEAEQRSLNRRVALKVLSSGLGLSTKAVLRFRREAEAAAKLHHTNIVPIYATGEDNGFHYYTMELVRGPSLDKVVKRLRAAEKLTYDALATSAADTSPFLAEEADDPAETAAFVPSQELRASQTCTTVDESNSAVTSSYAYYDTIASMIAGVAEALDHAHEQGVIHRDIKPSNLLMSPVGRLSINDFGLARILEKPGMTITGEFLGSPRYMSPEQVAAGRVPIDHRTDIYSLGASLYELLTLQPPFQGEQRDQVLSQIIHKEPTSPRRVNKRVPVDLDTICLKAMEKDPDRRYQTARQLASDLRNYVNRFAISAKRAGILGRTIKWVRRHPAVASLLVVVLLVAGFAALASYQAHRSTARLLAMRLQQAKDDAIVAAWNGQFDVAEKRIQEAELLGADHTWTRILRGQVAYHQSRNTEALEHFQQAARMSPDSVVANALVVLAQYIEGADMEYSRLVNLEPVSAEDYLFLGWAMGTLDPDRGLEMLDEAVKRRPASSIARLVRAEVRCWHAEDTAATEDLEAALDDLRTSEGMLGQTTAILDMKLYTYLTASHIYRDRGDDEKRMEAIARCEESVRALERFADHGRWMRAKYYEHIGESTRLLEEWRKAVEAKYAVADDFRQYAFQLCRRGEYDHAMEVANRLAERGGRGDAELVRAYILILEANEGSEEAAIDACKKAIQSGSRAEYKLLYCAAILRLLGDDEIVRQGSLNRQEPIERPALDWHRCLFDFHCQKISAERFIAQAGDSRRKQCEAHFFVAVRYLSEGERASAMEHFEKAIATNIFSYPEWDDSKLFLDRLKQDASWPPWIPPKKATAVSTN